MTDITQEMQIRQEHFACRREQLLIRGMQFYPECGKQQEKYPIIILSHGFKDNYLSMIDFCRQFAEMGYAAFCFGFCGGGGDTDAAEVKSDGDSRDMNLFTEMEDLITVKDYAKKLEFTDEKEIILVGFSQGGFVSGLTAAKCKWEITKLIMFFPAICIPDHARRGCLGGGHYDVAQVPEEIACVNTVIGKQFHDSVVDMDPYLELSAYKNPVLILQGLSDGIVDYSYAVRAKESYEKGQCQLQLIREMGHGYTQKQAIGLMASMRQFLQGKKEILTIRVIITHTDVVTEGEVCKSDIYFTGYCDTPYFQGCILPEGCDRQEHVNGVRTKIRAEYTLEGLDAAGERCHLHIVNQWGGQDWKPVIDTDSKCLAWLKDADLTAVLEEGSGGPTVRVYAIVPV